MIRVLIADDQEVVRKGMSTLLAYQKDLQIVGLAAHGEEAVAMTRDFSPDVVLMDIRMPVCDGIEATRKIRDSGSAARVLVITTFDDDELVIQALLAGASGYLLKDSPSEQIASGIRSVFDGNSVLGQDAISKIVAHLGSIKPNRKQMNLKSLLTEREREVLNLIGLGKNNKEIAQTLGITEGTTKNHVSKIFGQIGARDRIQAAIIAQNELE